MDFGSWEGQPWDAVPREELDAWAGDVWHYKAGGAESAAMVAARYRLWVEAVQTTRMNVVVAVTHAGVIRVALACSGRSYAAEWSTAAVEFGGVYGIGVPERAT